MVSRTPTATNPTPGDQVTSWGYAASSKGVSTLDHASPVEEVQIRPLLAPPTATKPSGEAATAPIVALPSSSTVADANATPSPEHAARAVTGRPWSMSNAPR